MSQPPQAEVLSHTMDVQPPTDSIASLRIDVNSLKHEVVGLEHRLFQVVRNAYWALTQREGWTSAKRLEAGAALVRYFLAGRTTVLLTIGIGGILALHASFMLAEQNRKLDLQNHLAVVASEIAEAQRNSQFAQLIPPLLTEVSAAQLQASRKNSGLRSGGQPEEVPLRSLSVRIAVLTQIFQPYRWIDRRVDADVLLRPTGSGYFFNAMQQVRKAFDSGFGTSPFEQGGPSEGNLELPLLTANRYSPERGLLLVNLYAAKFNFQGLTRFNVTFERAYAPGARLDGIDLTGLVGPDLSKKLNLQGSYFVGATLNRSTIGGANFVGSNFSGAEISSADASEAKWDGVNLQNAKIYQTNLQKGSLVGANLRGTALDLSNLSNADLSRSSGLTGEQLLKACVDVRTTKLPAGVLPEDYRVPPSCCKDWSESVYGFEKSDTGECIPTIS